MSTYSGPDTTSAQLLEKHEDHVNSYKELSGRLAAAEGDREAAIDSWMESSEDVAAAKLRKAIETATEKLRALAEDNLPTEALSDEEKVQLSEELDSLKTQVKNGITTITKVSEMFEIDAEGVAKALEEIGDPTRSNRGRKPGSSGSALPRTSVDIVLNGGKYTNQPAVAFSALAKMLDVEVKDLQLAFAEAAEVEHSKISEVKRPVAFDFTVNDVKYHVATTPKARKSHGSVEEVTQQDN